MLVNRYQCQELASIGEHGISLSYCRLLDDPLSDLVTQAEKILLKMASNKSAYTKLSSQLDQPQNEMLKWRDPKIVLIYALVVKMSRVEFTRFFNTSFFKPTDTIMVANSPRIGVGPGFDSQGCVTFFHKYCFPNLY